MTEDSQDRDDKPKRGRPRGNSTSLVYDSLREEILRLERPPGQHLDEQVLEKQYDVSRTPIREALIRLRSEGLVEFSPNRGHYVATIDIGELPRIFEALDLIQCAVFRLAALRRSPAQVEALSTHNADFWAAAQTGDHTAMSEANRLFHLTVADAGGNRYLRETYDRLLNVTFRIARLMFASADEDQADAAGYYRQVHDEHAQMIRLIEARDADAAETLSAEHTRLFCDRVAGFVQRRRKLRARPADFGHLSGEADVGV